MMRKALVALVCLGALYAVLSRLGCLASPAQREFAGLVQEHLDRARSLAAGYEYGMAEEEFQKLTLLAPTFPPGWISLGFVQIELQEYSAAIQSFQSALQVTDQLPIALRGLAMAQISSGQIKEGRAQLEKAAAMLRTLKEARYADAVAEEMGLIYVWLARADVVEKKNDDAVRHLEEAAGHNPRDPQVWFDYGRILGDMGRSREAIEKMEVCFKVDPYYRGIFRDPYTERLESSYTRLAKLYMKIGDFASAQHYLSNAIQNSRYAPRQEAECLMGACLAKLGQPDEARKFLEDCDADAGQIAAILGPASRASPAPAGAGASPSPASAAGGSSGPGAWSSPGAGAPTGSALPAGPRLTIRFAEDSRRAGLSQWRHYCGPTLVYNPEAIPPGVAVFDADGDGWSDIFVPTGADAFTDGRIVRTNTNAFWRNNGDGTFTDVTREAGLEGAGFSQGCAVVDFDNDGYPDLYVTAYGGSQLFHNNGDGTFTDVTQKARVPGGRFATGAAWADYDRDGWPDLFVGHYNDHDYTRPPPSSQLLYLDGDNFRPQSMGPNVGSGEENILYHNNRDGTFTEVTQAAGVKKRLHNAMTLGVCWTDLDDDGWPDLLVANDESPAYLFHNNHDGTFKEIATQCWLADGRANMGIEVSDFDNDGLLDVVLTHWVREGTGFYKGTRRHTYTDVALTAGITKKGSKITGWGVGLEDFDNDGLEDLFIANGLTTADHYDPNTFTTHKNFFAPQAPELYQNQGACSFADAVPASGLESVPIKAGRGAAFADLDNDGGMDVVVSNNNDQVYFFHNTTPHRGHWLEVELVGAGGDRSAAGARVSLAAGALHMLREVHAGSSYLSSSDPRVHFGLGAAARADLLTIRWPSGRTTSAGPLDADRILRIVEVGALPAAPTR